MAVSNHSTPDRKLELVSSLVKAEYQEMPGLSLTLEQAQRLFGVELGLCRRVLSGLLDNGYLRKTPSGKYARTA